MVCYPISFCCSLVAFQKKQALVWTKDIVSKTYCCPWVFKTAFLKAWTVTTPTILSL